jgi:uncharacterized protein YjbI with pentapeptide repeats
VSVWNKWRSDNPDIIPQLSRIDFGETLGVKNNLIAINLSNAYIESSSLFSLNFENVNFEGAILQNSNCYAASFGNVNFKSADLTLVNFTLSVLDNADFNEAQLGNTIFGDCNLSSIKNLETCHHQHSSIVDHSTLAKSENLPLSFLRGCGLPDFLIDNISVLKNEAIVFYSCFISYSSNDHEFASRLHSDLQNKGIRCWFAPEDMKGGRKSYDQINEAIRIHDKLLLVLSNDSMNSSWVATEIKKARKKEKLEKRQMLFPIAIVPYKSILDWELFDSDLGMDLAAEIRSYHIPDFSDWKNHNSYIKIFEKLMSDLKG